MKTRIAVFFLIGAGLIVYAFLTAAQIWPDQKPRPVTEIQWMTFDDGFASAAKSGKKVFIDVYTDWCTWCKKMDKDVYPDSVVVRLMSSKFAAIKLNAEGSLPITFHGTKLSEAQFARSVGISSYPTTLFLESDGKPISIVPGYLPAPRFSDVLVFFAEEHYKRGTFQEFLKRSKSQP